MHHGLASSTSATPQNGIQRHAVSIGSTLPREFVICEASNETTLSRRRICHLIRAGMFGDDFATYCMYLLYIVYNIMKCYKDCKGGWRMSHLQSKEACDNYCRKNHKDRLSSSPSHSTGRLVAIPIMGSQSFAWSSYRLSSTSNADHHHTKKNSRPQSIS